MVGVEQLHLPDLAIGGFRGIDELSIPRLGRVTLLAGKNGVGKTTVLDAVRVYVSRSAYRVLSELLRGREEVSVAVDEDGDPVLEPDWSALFYGRDVSHDTCIVVNAGNEELRIEKSYVSLEEASHISQLRFDFATDERIRVLRVTFRGENRILPCLVEPDAASVGAGRDRIRWSMRHRAAYDEPRPGINFESLGPGLLTNAALARFWDAVALTGDEDQAVRALRIALGESVDRVAVVGDDTTARRRGARRVVVRLQGLDRPVPLKSLGDGALRLFGVALALANSKNGFLLMDEAENGIHHSVQRDLWHMVLRTARENNVQVLATTHSWDCVRGFAEAAAEIEDAEGVLVRLDRVGEGLRAVEYSEGDLKIAAEQGIEVR